MDIYMNDGAAARLGAACLGARSPWTNVVAAGANHALGQNPALAAGGPESRFAAFRSAPAQTPAQMEQSAALMSAELLPTTVNVTRKHTNVHKTRINAGGYGAMGPHPERERLAS